MKKKRAWYEQKEFWYAVQPILFNKNRWAQAPQEVEDIISLLGIKPGSKMLDLCCGVGRHSIEFARRGFNVIGVDVNAKYLQEARKRAAKAGLHIEFIQYDMRRFSKPNTFDTVVNLFTSFGFFESQEEDYRVAQNVYSSLKKNGVFLIDVMGKEILARIFRERDWYEIDGITVLEERKTTGGWDRIECRWIMLKGSKRKEFKISLKLYSAVELSALLSKVGYKKVNVYGDLSVAPYDNKAKRLVVLAHKK